MFFRIHRSWHPIKRVNTSSNVSQIKNNLETDTSQECTAIVMWVIPSVTTSKFWQHQHYTTYAQAKYAFISTT